MQKQPTASNRRACEIASASSCVRERKPTMWASATALNNSARQRAVVMLDQRIAGGTEYLHGALVDAFQQQDLDVLLGERCLHGIGEPCSCVVSRPLESRRRPRRREATARRGCGGMSWWNKTRTDKPLKSFPVGMLG